MSVKSYPLSVVLHLLAFIIYGYSVIWQCLHPMIPGSEAFGGRLKFLTYWDLWIQLVTFSLALVADFIDNPNNNRNHTKPPTIVAIRDILFNGLAFPIGAFVTTSFWSIYAIDRELIFPTGIEKYYPIWLNHTTHTLVFPLVLIDNYLVCHNRPNNSYKSLIALSAVIVAYGLWMITIGVNTGYWVYPVLTILEWPQRALFMASACLAFTMFYLLGGLCYDMAWKSSSKSYTSSSLSSSPRHKIETRKKLR